MKKHELNFAEKIIYFLVVALLFGLVFSLIQTILLKNRFSVLWSVDLCILAGMFAIVAISFFFILLRYNVRREVQFICYNTYLIKTGILSIGKYFYYYGTFDVDGVPSESADPVSPRRLMHFQEGQSYFVWTRAGHPEQCCISRRSLVLLGFGYSLIAVGLLLIAFGVYTVTV